LLSVEGAAAGCLFAYIAASRKVVHRAEKIFGKKAEKMSAVCKLRKGKNLCGFARSNAAKPLPDLRLISAD
jgi:hypothetical protein